MSCFYVNSYLTVMGETWFISSFNQIITHAIFFSQLNILKITWKNKKLHSDKDNAVWFLSFEHKSISSDLIRHSNAWFQPYVTGVTLKKFLKCHTRDSTYFSHFLSYTFKWLLMPMKWCFLHSGGFPSKHIRKSSPML